MSPATRLLAQTARAASAALALIVLGSAGVAACGSGLSDAFAPFAGQEAGPRGADAAREAGPTFTLRITPSQDAETVVLGAPGKTVTFKAIRIDAASDASDSDVTGSVSWSVSPAAIAKAKGGGAFELSGVGGAAQVYATLSGVSATAAMTVKLTGSSFMGGASSSSGGPTSFGSATPITATTHALTLQYPLDGTVIPANLPPLDFQWAPGLPQG